MFEVLVLECYYELLTKRLNLNIILTFVKIIGIVFTVTHFIAVLSTVSLMMMLTNIPSLKNSIDVMLELFSVVRRVVF